MKNGIPMKSVWVLLLAVALLCATMAVCYAESLDEWNRSCRMKTAGATPVYGMSDPLCEGEIVTTIPANTYVRTSSGYDKWVGIHYWTKDGRRGSGWTYRSNLKAAIVFYIDEYGQRMDMQELQYQDLYGSIPPSGESGSDQNTSSGNINKPSSSKPASSLGSKKTSSAENRN